MSQICQSRISILPNKKQTVKNCPKTWKLFPKWPNLVTLEVLEYSARQYKTIEAATMTNARSTLGQLKTDKVLSSQNFPKDGKFLSKKFVKIQRFGNENSAENSSLQHFGQVSSSSSCHVVVVSRSGAVAFSQIRAGLKMKIHQRKILCLTVS